MRPPLRSGLRSAAAESLRRQLGAVRRLRDALRVGKPVDRILVDLARAPAGPVHAAIDVALARGRTDLARRLLDTLGGRREPRRSLVIARIAVIEGRAADALAALRALDELDDPRWRAAVLAVRADAHAVAGDRDAARRALTELRGLVGDEPLVGLRAGARPCAAAAADVLAGAVAPYR